MNTESVARMDGALLLIERVPDRKRAMLALDMLRELCPSEYREALVRLREVESSDNTRSIRVNQDWEDKFHG